MPKKLNNHQNTLSELQNEGYIVKCSDNIELDIENTSFKKIAYIVSKEEAIKYKKIINKDILKHTEVRIIITN